MAAPVYVLPWTDEHDATLELPIGDVALGYDHALFYDENDTAIDVPNDPEEGPPTGASGFFDEDDVFHAIAFVLSESNGIYEIATNAVRSAIEYALGQVPDLAYEAQFTVDWDNVGATNVGAAVQSEFANPQFDVRVRIETGPEELLGFGRGNSYRIRGEAVLELRGALNKGDVVMLTVIRELKRALRDFEASPVVMEDPFHSTLARDGAWWTIELRCPWRADFVQAVPDSQSGGTPDLVDWHDLIRAKLDALATSEGVTVLWDNAAGDPPGLDPFLVAHVLTGQTISVDHAAARKRRTPGVLKVVVYVRAGRGDRDGWRLVDALANEFRAATAGGVRFGTPSARRLGRKGRTWAIAVDLPYQVDEMA